MWNELRAAVISGDNSRKIPFCNPNDENENHVAFGLLTPKLQDKNLCLSGIITQHKMLKMCVVQALMTNTAAAAAATVKYKVIGDKYFSKRGGFLISIQNKGLYIY